MSHITATAMSDDPTMIEGVPVFTFDMSETAPPPLPLGFYYGLDIENGQTGSLHGPFDTAEQAIEGAKTFILEMRADIAAEEAKFDFVEGDPSKEIPEAIAAGTML